ncbi:MAG: TRIC cation channel family protein [Lachnospiraceae bacterium]|nr:TRIC cation channel family protein [Lachnospiraceae bacterium]
MNFEFLLEIMDILGTVAFAVSGAAVAAESCMDLFGMIALAIITATGGGIFRDIIIGALPPRAFTDPRDVLIAAATAFIMFAVLSRKKKVSSFVEKTYVIALFITDTLGLAAFTVEGVLTGVNAGFADNIFLLSFLGFSTAVIGGTVRDICAGRIPAIFRKHVYAVAAIVGAVTTSVMLSLGGSRGIYEVICCVVGFAIVTILRILAFCFKWNLPRIRTGR